MWLFLPSGFYSIVAKPGDERLVIRARVRADLERLRGTFAIGPIRAGAGTDYEFRASITREAFADGLATFAMDIDYPNFKSEVARKLGWERERVYHSVWSLLLRELRDDPSARNLGLEPHVPAAPGRRVRRRRR